MTLLQRADKILNDRSEEKERQYGPFSEGMKRAAKLASVMTSKDISSNDMYLCMVALKLSRESYNHKEDNILDAIVYLAAYNKDQCEE